MTPNDIIQRHRKLFLLMTAALLLSSAAFVSAGGKQEREQPRPQQSQPRDQGERIELDTADSTRQEEQDNEADANGSKPAWIIGRHALDDQLERTISENIERGYVPVGLDMLGGELTILYVLTDEIEFTRWTIQKVEDARNMDEAVTTWIQDGWMPLDITLIPGGVSFFLVETDHDIDSWRIEVIPATSEAVEKTYGEYRADGYVPYGLGSDPVEELFWVLFLRADGEFDVPNVIFDGFPNEDVPDGINNRLTSGALPWAMTRLPDRFFVQFIQP